MALTHVKKQYFIYGGVATTTVTFQYAMGNGASGTGRTVHFFLRGDLPDSATYNGVPLAIVDSDTSPFCRLYIAEDVTLPADTSNHDLVFTYSAGRTNQGVLVAEWSGAKQLGVIPPGAVASSAAGTTHPVTFNTTVDGVTVECFYLRIENRTMDGVPAGTPLHEEDAGVVYDGQRIIAATGPTPAGSATFTFDSSGNSNGAVAAVQLEEEVVAGDVDGVAAWSVPAIGFGGLATIPVAADLALAVPAPSFAAAGEIPIDAALALAVPAPSFAASGDVPVDGGLALSVPAPAFEAATTGQIEGTAGLSIPAISLAASGDVGVRGALTLALPAIAMSMTGTAADFSAKIITGRLVLRAAITGDTALRTAISGALHMRQHVTGRMALHPFVPIPGTPPTPGLGAVFGVLTLTSPAPSFTASGAVGGALPIEGVAALTIPAPSLSAAGEISEPPVAGVATITVPAIGFSASGTVTSPSLPSGLQDVIDALELDSGVRAIWDPRTGVTDIGAAADQWAEARGTAGIPNLAAASSGARPTYDGTSLTFNGTTHKMSTVAAAALDVLSGGGSMLMLGSITGPSGARGQMLILHSNGGLRYLLIEGQGTNATRAAVQTSTVFGSAAFGVNKSANRYCWGARYDVGASQASGRVMNRARVDAGAAGSIAADAALLVLGAGIAALPCAGVINGVVLLDAPFTTAQMVAYRDFGIAEFGIGIAP